ncbi:NAD-dependent epimerase/dehydratase family protein [Wohlfahrtiimonas chitiniclastica]|uniref:NAD-dependent epimerase/dehydratase family protein n=1 Tax=Wohlfahrtiimonas chitiniclastica TaxID=400946 RepID=UPI001BCD26B9|nr:NAD-dependent epimerase/dehydratase family protein [Wohlfahrtiimonas chitiniclastica]MBS7817384.1 NAD-dependent epimerase/dehydratase family protein [Wohlfahrtiimonas chitiniclastica]MBS7823042.1 NAD-dependent epimerase/dehydratase family protein [Wohlfahrtiimonas chitiniclastica]MBS7830856.1 NAD-dependent epimerase/dehydratase family protein [Wohlfahrtiimonas chitiniclastica]MBS7832824.1 NAD-dependent epimerase/dehydratase family protein [Wohlfahrtiimonas chitiniclastica]
MNETILLTGASGFLGRRIARFLQRTDAYLITTSRQQESYPNHLVRDLANVTAEIAQNVDTVIHLAGLNETANATDADYHTANVDHSVKLLESAMAAGVRRFIFISTTKVHGEAGMDITENSPFAPATAYARSKLAAEMALQQAAKDRIDLVILRLPLIYHIDAVNEFGHYIAMVKEGRSLPFDKMDNQRTMLALCNFESALNAVLMQPEKGSDTFIIADGFALSTTEIFKGIAVSAEVPLQLFYLPKIMAKASMKLTGRARSFDELWGSYVVNSQYAQTTLNWQPARDYVANLSN